MRYTRTRALLAALLLSACGAPEAPFSSKEPIASAQVSQLLRNERAIPGQYIVVLKEDVERDLPDGAASIAQELAARHEGTVLFTYEKALKGFAVRMPSARVPALLSDPRVAYVEEDGLVEPAGIQANPPWGLDRIDERTLPMDSYFRVINSGAGVNAYVIDSGIRLDHVQFGGRAVTGYDAVTSGGTANDCHGHGTHVAGIIGGSTVGIAKSVKLYAVRVLNCSGSGTVSGMIAAVDWVRFNHVKPAVAVMSVVTGASSSLNTAVTNAVNSGEILFVVAAGNNAADACNYSPASAPAAFTVGATTITDARAPFSNFGSCVDFYAPGDKIPSIWATSSTATYTYSGTSMAAAHTAGAAALILQSNPLATPSTVTSTLITNASTLPIGRLLYIPPPVINIISPTGGTVSGTVPINTLTSESVTMTRVEFFVGATFLGSDSSAPYSFSWNSVPHAGGSRTVTARAFNGSTQVGSDSVTVTVADITPPTTTLTSPTAGSTVGGGAVSLAAAATDNVGVTRVDFYVDSTFLGSDFSAPYTFSWNTAGLANGTYSLSTRAFDAAGNMGTAAPVSVTVSCATTLQLLNNADFESGSSSFWVANPFNTINNSNLFLPPRTGSFKASLGGSNSTATLFQDVTFAASECTAQLRFFMRIDTIDGLPNDSLTVTLRNTSGAVLQTLATFSNLDPGFSDYAEVTLPINVGSLLGTTVRIHFQSTEDSFNATTFLIDDTALNVTR
jgi:subtilisin family serine protease